MDNPISRGQLRRQLDESRLAKNKEQLMEMDPFATMTLEKLEPSKQMDVALAFARKILDGENEDWGMLLAGRCGHGKTHLMLGLARELVKSGRPIWWSSSLRFVQSVQDTYSPGAMKSRDQVIRTPTTYPYIFLDDLGKERPSQDVDIILYELLDRLQWRRMQEEPGKKPTLIVSTNLTSDEYNQHIMESTRDRIAGITHPFTLGTERSTSFRKRGRNKW